MLETVRKSLSSLQPINVEQSRTLLTLLSWDARLNQESAPVTFVADVGDVTTSRPSHVLTMVHLNETSSLCELESYSTSQLSTKS